MAHILNIAFAGEGTTDSRLLPAIIKNVFDKLVANCNQQVDISEMLILDKEKGSSFSDELEKYAIKAKEANIDILCIHVDADDKTNKMVLANKISPAFAHLAGLKQDEICTNYLAVIPVYMSESWLLADLALLKKELGTTLSDQELGFAKNPEHFTDPKAVINNAINLLISTDKKRYKDLRINDLYQIIGQTTSLEKLELLPSYLAFKADAEKALKKLNFCK